MEPARETWSQRFGRLVRRVREAKGGNQHEIAQRAGYANGSPLSKIELGKREKVGLDEFERIGAELGLELRHFLEWNEAVDGAQEEEWLHGFLEGTGSRRRRAAALMVEEIEEQLGRRLSEPVRTLLLEELVGTQARCTARYLSETS